MQLFKTFIIILLCFSYVVSHPKNDIEKKSSAEIKSFRAKMNFVLKIKLEKYWELQKRRIFIEYLRSSMHKNGGNRENVKDNFFYRVKRSFVKLSGSDINLGIKNSSKIFLDDVRTSTQKFTEEKNYVGSHIVYREKFHPRYRRHIINEFLNISVPQRQMRSLDNLGKKSNNERNKIDEIIPLKTNTSSTKKPNTSVTYQTYTIGNHGFNISLFQRQPRETLNTNTTFATPRRELKFLDVPPGGGMKVPDLKIEGGYLVFSLVNRMIKFLQPHDFPAELLKDWVWKRLTNTQLMLEIIHVEAGFIGCVTVLLILSLALPSAVLVHTCCRLTSKHNDEYYSEMSDHELKCRRIALITALDFILILLPVGIIGMFTSNEQLTQAIQRAPEVNLAVLSDLDVFVRNTQLQIRFVATTSVDRAVDAAVASLEEVEDLLGKPIQKELAMETGLDVALDALSDICTASKDVATEVLTLRAEAQAAREAARISQDRLKELRRQVETTKKQCIQQDRSLCDTIDTSGLEVVFKIDKLLTERKLSKLRYLGEDNLTQAVSAARLEYQNIPQRVVKDTENTLTEIKNILVSQRELLYGSVKALEEVSDDFTTSISVATTHSSKYIDLITNLDQWRWLSMLIACVAVLLVWFLLTCAVICANCGCLTKVAPTLYIAVGLVVLFTLGLWLVASGALLIGGNSDVFICKPLQDDPNFATLTMIFDHPGLLYKRGGLFSNILKGNDSMDVPVKQILKECRLNQPAFPTFSLNRIFNIDSITNHLTWPKLHAFLSNLTVDIKDIEILKPALQKSLQDLSQASRVNLTIYRTQISGQTTGTDLSSFSDQLERVANQMSDLTTSARMETLASRTRKLFSNNVQKLEKHKEEIIYKLTTLEVHLLPLQRQANQSLSHLKTIQYYIINQGSSISERKTNQFVEKLVRYLERFREHVLNELTYEVAPCRPVWDTFQVTRRLLCDNVVEPINGFWVSTTWCLLLFMALTPITMVLAMDYCYFANSTLHRDLGELLLDEQAGWVSTPQSTPETEATPEQSAWTTPRHPSEQLLVPQRPTPEQLRIPSPRRLAERLAERRVSPRQRRLESLRMIEQMPWYTTSVTPAPRGWL